MVHGKGDRSTPARQKSHANIGKVRLWNRRRRLHKRKGTAPLCIGPHPKRGLSPASGSCAYIAHHAAVASALLCANRSVESPRPHRTRHSCTHACAVATFMMCVVALCCMLLSAPDIGSRRTEVRSHFGSICPEVRRSPAIRGHISPCEARLSIRRGMIATALRRWAKISAQCETQEEVADVRRTAEVIKNFTRTAVRVEARRRSAHPLVLSITADGTPLRVKQDIVETQRSATVRRRGGHLVEFLVMRGYFFSGVGPSGPELRRACLRDPMPMTLGKSAEHHYRAICQEFDMLQSLGAESVCLTHYGFDGAMFRALRRLLHARHGLVHQSVVTGECSAEERGRLWLKALLDWQVYTRCPCHDGSKALEWALKPFAEGDTWRDLFITVESLRNGYVQLHRNLKGWLCTNLLVDDKPFDQALSLRWWQLVGLEPEWAERLSEVNLRWDGNSLRMVCVLGV